MRYDWIAAFRGITRNPGFAALVVLTFALGIGSNAAIFSVAYGVLLRPLTFPDQDRLVRFTEMVRKNVEFNVSYPNFLSWRERSRSFEQLAIYNPVHEYLFRGPHGVEAIPVATAEGHLFAMLGYPPALGRSFTEEEPSPAVTVLTHAFWEKRLGRDPNVLGRALQLGPFSLTVIGVLPPEFVLGNSELYVPIRPTLTPVSLDRGNHPGFAAIGRLKPGVTLAQARAEMQAISEELERQYPATNRDTRVKVTPLLESIVGGVQTPLLLLMGAVGFVLLIACANIANLLLAKAASRTREVAIRMALGAGRAGVLRFFLAESLILAGLGGAAGRAACGLAGRPDPRAAAGIAPPGLRGSRGRYDLCLPAAGHRGGRIGGRPAARLARFARECPRGVEKGRTRPGGLARPPAVAVGAGGDAGRALGGAAGWRGPDDPDSASPGRHRPRFSLRGGVLGRTEVRRPERRRAESIPARPGVAAVPERRRHGRRGLAASVRPFRLGASGRLR